MLVYIAYMVRKRPDLLTSVLWGSLFSLGFILTLGALVASLIHLAANDYAKMNSLVGSFGAVLTATIVGLIARLAVTSSSLQSLERRGRLEFEIEYSLNAFAAQHDVLTTQVVNLVTKGSCRIETGI